MLRQLHYLKRFNNGELEDIFVNYCEYSGHVLQLASGKERKALAMYNFSYKTGEPGWAWLCWGEADKCPSVSSCQLPALLSIIRQNISQAPSRLVPAPTVQWLLRSPTACGLSAWEIFLHLSLIHIIFHVSCSYHFQNYSKNQMSTSFNIQFFSNNVKRPP